jgi:hypothetical protein
MGISVIQAWNCQPPKTRCQLEGKPLTNITELGTVASERTGDAPVVEKDCSRQRRRRGSIMGTAGYYETGRPEACFRRVANAPEDPTGLG